MSSLKRYEEALPRFEEVLAIRQKVFGARHERTIEVVVELAFVRQQACLPRRDINVGHEFRMCSLCENVQESMSACPCFRAWYCGADCQLQHWAAHQPHCYVCNTSRERKNKMKGKKNKIREEEEGRGVSARPCS